MISNSLADAMCFLLYILQSLINFDEGLIFFSLSHAVLAIIYLNLFFTMRAMTLLLRLALRLTH